MPDQVALMRKPDHEFLSLGVVAHVGLQGRIDLRAYDCQLVHPFADNRTARSAGVMQATLIGRSCKCELPAITLRLWQCSVSAM